MKLAGERAFSLALEFGSWSGVMAEALRFCFDVCARGTNLEGAALLIIESGEDAETERSRGWLMCGICGCSEQKPGRPESSGHEPSRDAHTHSHASHSHSHAY